MKLRVAMSRVAKSTLCLVMAGIILAQSVLSGCNGTAPEPTPTPTKEPTPITIPTKTPTPPTTPTKPPVLIKTDRDYRKKLEERGYSPEFSFAATNGIVKNNTLKNIYTNLEEIGANATYAISTAEKMPSHSMPK